MADTLTLHLSGDAWNGSPQFTNGFPQFTVDLDGTQLAEPTSVTTPHASGFQDFTYSGDFSAGPHTVAVHFLNDGYGGSADTDRNLYVGGITFNGTDYAGETAQNDAMNGQPDADPNAAEMYVNGTVTFNDVVGTSPPLPMGPDTLVVYAAGLQADFSVIVDGTVLDYAVPATGGGAPSGPINAFTFSGDFGDGPHTVALQLNGHPSPFAPIPALSVYGIALDGKIYNGAEAVASGDSFTDPRNITILDSGTITFQNVTEGTLATNVTLNGGALFNEHLNGGLGDDLINGGAGNDELSGGAGSDTFVAIAGEGNDTIHFQPGAGGDIMDLVGYGYTSFADVQAHMTQTASGDTLLTHPNGETTLFTSDTSAGNSSPVTPDSFTADNFVLDGQSASTADELVVHVSEDAFHDAAEFAVLVDGQQVGVVQTAFASHADGDTNDISLVGHFGPGPHTVDVTFLNDAYGGTADNDRNLYVEGVTYNGVDYAGQGQPNTGAGPDTDPNAAEVFSNGTVTFDNVGGSSSTGQHIVGTDGNDTLTGGPGDDTIEGLGGNDHLDGQAGADTLLGGAGNDSFVNSAGNDTMTGGAGSDTYTFSSPDSPITTQTGSPTITDFHTGAGGDTVVFDHYADLSPAPAPGQGVFIFDDIYQHLVDVDGGTQLTLDGLGANHDITQTFTFDGISRDDFTPANLFVSEPWFNGNVNGTEGPDTLVVHASEDAWNGDAIMRVTVDGHEISGNVAVTTAHSSGGFEDLAFTGNFGDGPHTVGVSFVNDAYGGTADTDRNLYVGSITFNGVNYPGEGQPNTGAGADTDPNSAEVLSNGTVTFDNVGGSGSNPPPSGGGSSTVVLHLSEDAFQGDAQFTVAVEGVQQGAAQTVTASHSAGQVQDITLTGDFGTQGPGTISINFLNDAWGGSADADRNLYVQSIDVNGVHFQGNIADNNAANGGEASDPSAAVMDIDGTATFHIDHSAPPLMG